MAQDVALADAPADAETAPATAQPPRRRFRRSTSHKDLKRRIEASTNRVVNGRFSIPVIVETLTLRSLESQRIVESCYRRAMRSLFNLDVILGIIDRSDDAKDVWSVIDKAIADVLKKVSQERQRLEHIRNNKQITRELTYSLSVPVTFQISSASAMDFCQIVKEFDDVIGLLDLLVMTREVPRKDRREVGDRYLRMIEGLTSRIVGLERRAFDAAARAGRAADLADLDGDDPSRSDGETPADVAPEPVTVISPPSPTETSAVMESDAEAEKAAAD